MVVRAYSSWLVRIARGDDERGTGFDQRGSKAASEESSASGEENGVILE